MTDKKPWVDGPFELIPSALSGVKKGVTNPGTTQLAGDMIIVHNFLIRGVNAIYLQADGVCTRGTPKDRLDFAHFAYQWSVMVDHHHGSEEKTVFPEIADIVGVPDIMEGNIKEHEAFHDGLHEYQAYLDKVIKEEEQLDAGKLKGIIDSFMPVLRGHFSNEIVTLKELSKYEDKCDWKAWQKDVANRLVKQSMNEPNYKTDILPMPLIFHDKTFEDGIFESFPPFGWLLFMFLKFMFLGKRADWWRFSGCDLGSMPKELPFA